MPESGCNKKLVMVMRTLRLIQMQTVGGAREEIPTIWGHKDFLKNTEDSLTDLASLISFYYITTDIVWISPCEDTPLIACLLIITHWYCY